MKIKTELWADGQKIDRPEVTDADPTPDVREKNTQRDSKRETGISDDDIKTFKTVKGCSAKKIEARSNITLEKRRNEKEKTKWEGTYRNGVIASLILLHCTDRSICEKTDEAIRLGNGRYPTTIQAASALLTAAAKQQKKRNNRNRKNWNRRNRNKKNRYDGSGSD